MCQPVHLNLFMRKLIKLLQILGRSTYSSKRETCCDFREVTTQLSTICNTLIFDLLHKCMRGCHERFILLVLFFFFITLERRLCWKLNRRLCLNSSNFTLGDNLGLAKQKWNSVTQHSGTAVSNQSQTPTACLSQPFVYRMQLFCERLCNSC